MSQILTSDQEDGHHQLEDAVDEWEGEHDLQLCGAEGQLGDGATQLGVLETRLQSDGPSPWGWRREKFKLKVPVIASANSNRCGVPPKRRRRRPLSIL